MPLFPDSVYNAGVHGVLDDGSNRLVWSYALLLNVVALPVEVLSLRQAIGERWGYSPRSQLKNRFVCLRSEFIFEVERLALISSLSSGFSMQSKT